MKVRFLNQNEFNQNIQAFAKKLDKDKIPAFIIGLAIKLYSGIILKTPVDTGRARGNWIINVGSITDEEVNSGFSDSNGDITRLVGQAFSKLKAMAKSRMNQIIYMFNNVNYILDLENGGSNQAPAGMVRVTMAELAAGFNPALQFIDTARSV